MPDNKKDQAARKAAWKAKFNSEEARKARAAKRQAQKETPGKKERHEQWKKERKAKENPKIKTPETAKDRMNNLLDAAKALADAVNNITITAEQSKPGEAVNRDNPESKNPTQDFTDLSEIDALINNMEEMEEKMEIERKSNEKIEEQQKEFAELGEDLDSMFKLLDEIKKSTEHKDSKEIIRKKTRKVAAKKGTPRTKRKEEIAKVKKEANIERALESGLLKEKKPTTIRERKNQDDVNKTEDQQKYINLKSNNPKELNEDVLRNLRRSDKAAKTTGRVMDTLSAGDKQANREALKNQIIVHTKTKPNKTFIDKLKKLAGKIQRQVGKIKGARKQRREPAQDQDQVVKSTTRFGK